MPKVNKKAPKDKGGRPTLFKPEYTQQLIDFFDIEPYKEFVYEQSQEYYKDGEVKKTSLKKQLIPEKLPTLFRFAKKIGVVYSTVWRWAEEGKDENEKSNEEMVRFCNAYKAAKELQKEFLINNGLANASNASVTIFTAKNLTDMRDVQEVKVKKDDLSDEEITLRYNRIKRNVKN